MLVKELINKLNQVDENNEVVIVDSYNNLFSTIEVLIAKNERDRTKELIVIDVNF